ncbi:hypothetical protein GCM10023149_37780 [Mucilaginibacter gynuensis]|uniref:PilJ/NarX-like methyl-accepting chemotaxis transducer n=1 Tax=Mucilaginibacter gynuensis TaxID=1302236 RepID=A0ABP8GYI8_9SPHI
MKTVLLLCCLSALVSMAVAQKKVLDIVSLHQLVNESISEHKLQEKARDRQRLVVTNEQANLTMLTRLKITYRTIQNRCHLLGTALDATRLGSEAYPLLLRISRDQQEILQLAAQNPTLTGLGFRSSIQFVDKAESLIRYITGLLLSAGAINQMLASDRKVLFDYVLAELHMLQGTSSNLLHMMQSARLSNIWQQVNPFQDYIDADKSIASDIIRHAKYLKP